MKLTKTEKDVLIDALTKHIEEMESYGPDDAEERIKAANEVLCKIGHQKLVRKVGVTRTWEVYVPTEAAWV